MAIPIPLVVLVLLSCDISSGIAYALKKRDAINPVLKEKWEQIFRNLDLYHDNSLDKHDMDIILARYQTTPNMTAAKKREAADLFNEAWTKQLGENLTDTLTMEQYVAKKQQSYEDGTIVTNQKHNRNKIFDIIDTNNDSNLTFTEFQLSYKVTGNSDDPTLRDAFNTIDKDGDGKITRDEYIDAYVAYVIDPNITIDDLPLYGKGDRRIDWLYPYIVFAKRLFFRDVQVL